MRCTSAWALAGSPPSYPKIRRTGWPLRPPRVATSAAQARAPWKKGAMVAPRIPLWTPNDPSRISPPVVGVAGPGPAPAPGAGDGPAGPAEPAGPPPAPELAAFPAPALPPPPPAPAAGAGEPGVARAEAGAGAAPPSREDRGVGGAADPSATAVGDAVAEAPGRAPPPEDCDGVGGALPAGRRSWKGARERARRSRPSREPQAVPATAVRTATTRILLAPGRHRP